MRQNQPLVRGFYVLMKSLNTTFIHLFNNGSSNRCLVFASFVVTGQIAGYDARERRAQLMLTRAIACAAAGGLCWRAARSRMTRSEDETITRFLRPSRGTAVTAGPTCHPDASLV